MEVSFFKKKNATEVSNTLFINQRLVFDLKKRIYMINVNSNKVITNYNGY